MSISLLVMVLETVIRSIADEADAEMNETAARALTISEKDHMRLCRKAGIADPALQKALLADARAAGKAYAKYIVGMTKAAVMK